MPSGQSTLLWKCSCADCGTEKWIYGVSLRRQNILRCPCDRVKLQVGTKKGDFTVTELIGNDRWVICTCKCGRIRKYPAKTFLQREAAINCGCSHLNNLYIYGDPSLPSGIQEIRQLFSWAGVSHQLFDVWRQAHGWKEAVHRMGETAEKNNPGEGWRIAMILPLSRPWSEAITYYLTDGKCHGLAPLLKTDISHRSYGDYFVTGLHRLVEWGDGRRYYEWWCECSCGSCRWFELGSIRSLHKSSRNHKSKKHVDAIWP